MPETKRTRPTASIAPAIPPLLVPQLPIAPLLPPVHVVDLMTAAGSAIFRAQWKAMEAKIIECPALSDAMPRIQDDVRCGALCRRQRFRQFRVAGDCRYRTRRQARRGYGVVLLVPHNADNPRGCRWFRHRRGDDGAAGECRRLRGVWSSGHPWHLAIDPDFRVIVDIHPHTVIAPAVSKPAAAAGECQRCAEPDEDTYPLLAWRRVR